MTVLFAEMAQELSDDEEGEEGERGETLEDEAREKRQTSAGQSLGVVLSDVWIVFLFSPQSHQESCVVALCGLRTGDTRGTGRSWAHSHVDLGNGTQRKSPSSSSLKATANTLRCSWRKAWTERVCSS